MLVFGLASANASSQSVMLGWNADTAPGVAGYALYYGAASGQYTQKIDVGNTTTATLSNLAAGIYYCVVTAYDGAHAESLPSNEASFTVAAAISPTLPVAMDDAASVNSNGSVAIPVLANDSGPAGSSLTVVSVTQPAGGAAAINADGTITFTPASSFAGATSFNYTVRDSAGDTATATVTVTVRNNPPPAAPGTFTGLVTNSSPQPTNEGSAQFRLQKTGAFSGRVVVGKSSVTVAGSFGTSGQFTKVVTLGGRPATITLSIDGANDRIIGTISVGGFTSTISAAGSQYTAAHPPQQAGLYTAMIQPQSQNGGYGIARITVTATGAVRFTGKLANGGAVNAASTLDMNGTFPLSARISGSRYVQGSISFQNISTSGSESDLTASLTLLSVTGAQTTLSLVGSAYVPPSTLPPASALALTQTTSNASLDITGGGLSGQIVKQVTLTTLNQIIVLSPGSDRLTTSVNSATGLFTGRFYDSANRRTRTFQGILFQKRSCGAGYFAAGLNVSGAVTLTGH